MIMSCSPDYSWLGHWWGQSPRWCRVSGRGHSEELCGSQCRAPASARSDFPAWAWLKLDDYISVLRALIFCFRSVGVMNQSGHFPCDGETVSVFSFCQNELPILFPDLQANISFTNEEYFRLRNWSVRVFCSLHCKNVPRMGWEIAIAVPIYCTGE